MAQNDTHEFDFSGKTILVAEDNPISTKLIAALLSRVQARMIHAGNGQQAIEICEAHPEVDLVLMDIQMPGMGGLEATRRIKSLRPGLPVIATTAHAYDEDESACLKAGCTAYVSKPLKFRELYRIMDSLLQAGSNG